MADIKDDEENYLRAVLLLLKGGRYIALEVLRQAENDTIKQSGKDIHTVLQEAKTQLKKKSDRKQREKLFPDDGSKTQSVTWDISLITLVILKCYKSSLAQLELEAVETIRDERNKILAHSSDASLTRGDYDDVCRELENAINTLSMKFNESVRHTCEERVQSCLKGNLQTAKHDVTTTEDNDNLCKVLRKKIEKLQKKNTELRSKIERMIKEKRNRVFKTIQVVDTELEISAHESDGHAVDMAEQILTVVIDEAIRRVGSDASVNEIRMAVDDIINEIEQRGMKVVSVEQSCIILRVECSSYYQCLQLLDLISDAKFQVRLKKLAEALIGLKTGLQHPLELAFRISKKSVDSLLECLRDEDAETKRKISLPVQCASVAGLASFWNFIEEDRWASSVERLSNALSKHLGKDISIKMSLNQEQVLNALQGPADKDSATPVASACGAGTVLRSLPEPPESPDVSELFILQHEPLNLYEREENRRRLRELEPLDVLLQQMTNAKVKLQQGIDRFRFDFTASAESLHLTTDVRKEKEKSQRHEKEEPKIPGADKDSASLAASARGPFFAFRSLPESPKSSDVNEIFILQHEPLHVYEQEERRGVFGELDRLDLILREMTISEIRLKQGIDRLLSGSTVSAEISHLTTEVKEGKEKTKRHKKEKPTTPADARSNYQSGTGQHKSSFPSKYRKCSLESVTRYFVGIPVEGDCCIQDCCMLPNDEILLLDSQNRKLKKLNAIYNVTNTYNLRDVVSMFGPSYVTYTGNSEAVVCSGDSLVYVNVFGNMSVRKTLKLDTYCTDVACLNDRLYVLYDKSIHVCTLEGETISVLPILPLEETGGSSHRIAVANDGRMYVTTYTNGLISQDSSGNVINILPDDNLRCVCVDDQENVWAGGYKTVYKISADGDWILDTTQVNTMQGIRSLCYDKHRSSLILCDNSNNINVARLNFSD